MAAPGLVVEFMTIMRFFALFRWAVVVHHLYLSSWGFLGIFIQFIQGITSIATGGLVNCKLRFSSHNFNGFFVEKKSNMVEKPKSIVVNREKYFQLLVHFLHLKKVHYCPHIVCLYGFSRRAPIKLVLFFHSMGNSKPFIESVKFKSLSKSLSYEPRAVPPSGLN